MSSKPDKKQEAGLARSTWNRSSHTAAPEAGGRLEAGDRLPAQPAIELENLSKVYRGGKRAVDDISLSIPPGQVFGFLGPNGAGKTTTIKMLCGLVTPTAGRARLNGFDVNSERRAAVRQIGAVLEGGRNVYWQFSAWQNLLYFGRLKGLRTAVVRPRAEALLRELGLWDRRHGKVGEFSRGMQQKVAVASALVSDPSIVLLDEPTLGLDVEASRTVKEWITSLAREHGKTIVLTTHQLHIAEELCDRIAVIRTGQIIADLPVAEMLGLFHQRDSYDITVVGEFQLGDLPSLPAGFTATTGDGKTVISGMVSEPETLYRVLEELRARRLVLQSVIQPQPDLEEIFLDLIREGKVRA